MDRYVTTRAYAQKYGNVHTATVRKWIAAGLVTCTRVNQRVILILDTPPVAKPRPATAA